MVRPLKTWERRERVMDMSGKWISPGMSDSFPFDGWQLGEEIGRRLTDGWEILASGETEIVLKSPATNDFGQGQPVYVVASYHVEGY